MQNEISGRKRHCTFRLLMGLLLLCSLLCAPGTGVLAESGEILIPLHVEAGTNLITLAKTYCKRPEDWKTIARINRLSPPYVIYADGEIEVPRELLQLEPLSLQAVAVKGEVILQQANGERTALQTGSWIASGDTVVTGEDSFAHLVFPNGVHTRVEPQSTLTVSYLFRLSDGHIKVELALTRGEVVNTINRKLRSNDSMRTKTPVVVTGIRGTSYRLKVENPRTTRVETLNGEVSVQSGQRAVRLRADEGVKASQGQRLGAVHTLPSPPSLKGVPTLYRTLPAKIHVARQRGIALVSLRLSTDAEGLASVYECSAPAGQPLVVQEVPDGRYHAFLTVTDVQGFESRDLARGEIEIRTMPPAPVVTAPRNSSVQWGEVAQMSWLESAQAVGYRVQIGRDPAFTDLVEEQQVTSPAHTSSSLPPGNYYGRVQAEAEDGFLSDFSSVIGWQQRETPSLSGMEGKSGEAPLLQWASMGENWRYDLQVSTDKDFKDLILDQHGLDTPSYAFPNPLVPGRYSVRLRGLPPDGQPTPWTPSQTLQIKNPPKNLEGGLIGALILGIILL